MRFLGSIGAIMKGSGLEDLLAQVYAENSITHMISRKAVSRANRGHLLVDSSLMSLIFNLIKVTADIHFEELDEFYKRALEGELDEVSLQALTETSVYKVISESIETMKAVLGD